jgi:hypothetical protein
MDVLQCMALASLTFLLARLINPSGMKSFVFHELRAIFSIPSLELW